MDKIESETIRNNSKMKNIVLKIEMQQLRWFGHVVRMNDEKW